MADIDDVFIELHRLHERLDEIRTICAETNTLAGRFRDKVLEMEARVKVLESKGANGGAEAYL